MFTRCRHDDGKLEVMGLTGVVHLGQIQSGLRTAIRLAQGAHVSIYSFLNVARVINHISTYRSLNLFKKRAGVN